MKPGIHPEYRKVVFHDTSVDAYFIVGSTYRPIEPSSGKMEKPILTAHLMCLQNHILFTQVIREWYRQKVVLQTSIVVLHSSLRTKNESSKISKKREKPPSRLPDSETSWPTLRDLQNQP